MRMCCHLDEETDLIELLKEVDSGDSTVETWSFINLIEIHSALERLLSVNNCLSISHFTLTELTNSPTRIL